MFHLFAYTDFQMSSAAAVHPVESDLNLTKNIGLCHGSVMTVMLFSTSMD